MQVIIELRNYTGIMLIDRNDDLCILYEKYNIQETVLRTGDTELARLGDEARVLKTEVAEIERSIAVTRKLLPKIPMLDHNVATLQKEILLKRREREALELQVEDPNNMARWRMLPGRIKDKDELRIKLNQLEERLNDKKEQLLERELILDEVC
jgi:predicted RNase H-like nuclease (RuvC/YqgF family)